MRTIKVTIWRPSKTEPGIMHPAESFTCGSWSQARREAERRMGTLYTTRGCYHRDVRRAPHAELERRGRRKQIVSQPVEIVPSVGELGWAP